jgi:predicted membrane protein
MSNDAENTPDSRSNKTLRWVIAIGALAWLFVILASVYHPYLTERIKFFTGSTLSLFVLLAVIVQAIIYRGQWKAMQGQLDAMKEQAGVMRESLMETRKIVDHNERVFEASQVQMKQQFAATEYQMAIADIAVRVSERTAKAAENSVEIANMY